MGYALSKTEGAALSWSQLPLFLALSCWAASFFSGCRSLQFSGRYVFGEANVLAFHRMIPNLHPRDKERIEDVAKPLLLEFRTKAVAWSERQFWFLVIGGIGFVGWHILEMALVTF
jgi:hypothetical protein